MEYINIEIDNNLDLISLVEKDESVFLIHQFYLHQIIEWWETNLHFDDKISIDKAKIRSLNFDLLVDFEGLKKVLKTNEQQIDIYQFSKAPSGTLRIEDLPEESKFNILKQNGLLNYFSIKFEELRIGSFDPMFISQINNSIDE